MVTDYLLASASLNPDHPAIVAGDRDWIQQLKSMAGICAITLQGRSSPKDSRHVMGTMGRNAALSSESQQVVLSSLNPTNMKERQYLATNCAAKMPSRDRTLSPSGDGLGKDLISCGFPTGIARFRSNLFSRNFPAR
jgi:hypothetical protein